ncbi:hypothetical protein [Wolbachia endosymbiont of Folsomia candida]|uniref:hypothetical protein n=1 Tax=Wolbachia endosymbiont of Folsomia candida TaxID=169402 RepID=UPI000A9D8613|nr:hypothetical protein [Wolbachia endosymbiont of Folsomia candida]APR98595.1 hypothetical protein ASM33_05075 [Wolbachia endosymbiont of Folsomia candida]
MIGKKITVLQDLYGEKIQFIFDRHRLFKGMLRAFDKVKPENKRPEGKKAEVPSPQNVVSDSSNLEEGLNYHLNQKSLNNPELLSPFNVLGR